jgi:ferrous iron transport protein B
MVDSASAFIRRAGTLIFASMIVVWALLYFPNTDPSGQGYDRQIDELRESIEMPSRELSQLTEANGAILEQRKSLAAGRNATPDAQRQATLDQLETEHSELFRRVDALEAQISPTQDRMNQLQAEWTGQSILGRVGKTLEPAFVPLGWDWRVGMAALASFPAREVIVGTLGLIYQAGKVDSDEIRAAPNAGETRLGQALQAATWDNDPSRKVFTIPTALSLMVFFALCCQCASTLAVIRRETRSWLWPLFTFGYMTILAYVGAMLVYQVGSLLS